MFNFFVTSFIQKYFSFLHTILIIDFLARIHRFLRKNAQLLLIIFNITFFKLFKNKFCITTYWSPY